MMPPPQPQWFEQDGVHIYMRLQASGLGLHYLSPSHLVAFAGDKRIEGHVLGLERSHLHSILMENATQGGHQQALTC